MSRRRTSRDPRESLVRASPAVSVRGKVISHPIPIPGPDDDEFPIRTPGSGIALPLDAAEIERLMVSAAAASERGITSYQTGIAISDFGGPPQPPPPPPTARDAPPDTATATASSAPRDSVSSVTKAGSLGPPARHRSSVRCVLGRMFGRRRKNSTRPGRDERGASHGAVRAEHHRSVSAPGRILVAWPLSDCLLTGAQDPSALRATPPRTSTGARQRSTSPPDALGRPRRSHGLMPEPAPRPPSPPGPQAPPGPREKETPTPAPARPRRATTPSRLVAPSTGLSPRPSSTNPRTSRVMAEGPGRASLAVAVTASGHANRRSRSVGELRQAAVQNEAARRRRSDEIRYWRESHEAEMLSPVSSHAADIDSLRSPVTEKAQPFNFGPVGDLVGMKITQAVSLETRMRQLEDRLSSVERRVDRASRDALLPLKELPPLPTPPRDGDGPTRAGRPAPQPASQTRPRSPSRAGRRPPRLATTLSPRTSSDALPALKLASAEVAAGARPLSTSTTIRWVPSYSPTLQIDSPLTGEHFNALTSMILAEQASRQQLEAAVLDLQRQLQAVLAATVAPPPPPHSAPGSPPSPPPPAPPPQIRIAHGGGGPTASRFDHDDESSDDGHSSSSNANDEIFRTPAEERADSGRTDFFGDFAARVNRVDLHLERDDEAGIEHMPRTMSVGQITLGRGAAAAQRV